MKDANAGKTFDSVNDLISVLAPSVVQNIKLENTLAKHYQLDIKRDDLIHPVISGNKWRKLKYLLLEIEQKGHKRVAAMGGPYSNFLHALSYVCFLLGWHCQLFIRGYKEQPLTATLEDCVSWNAQLNFVDRMQFRSLRDQPPQLDNNVFWIKEGGQHQTAMLGMAELVAELEPVYDYILIASATGTSVAGLVLGVEQNNLSCQVIGISVVKNRQQQLVDVRQAVANSSMNWQIISDYEFAGFAKKNPMIESFCDSFSQQFQIPIEPVYTGRSFFATFDMLKKGYFKKNSKILLLHCGGLQGARSI